MSWKASAWAKQLRLGSPAAKSILMCLADYADPAGLINGWASQAQLAEDAEVSERSVREWMQRLEDMGIMTRRRQSRANGARAVDIIQLHLSVSVADAAGLPANSAGRPNRQPDADLPADDDDPTGTEFRAHKEEPPISDQSPPVERERARADDGQEGQEDRKAVERAFERAWQAWPTSVADSRPAAWDAWQGLGAEAREAAARDVARYVAASRAAGRKLVCSFGVYLRERRWEQLPPPAPEGPRHLEAKAFGKAWAALRLKTLLAGRAAGALIPDLTAFERQQVAEGRADEAALMRGKVARHGYPAVNRMHEQAAVGRSAIVPSHMEALGAGFEQVRVGSERWEAWMAEHERRGWPWLPDTGKHEWVYFPAGGPEGLGAFEEAVRAAEEAVSAAGANREAAE